MDNSMMVQIAQMVTATAQLANDLGCDGEASVELKSKGRTKADEKQFYNISLPIGGQVCELTVPVECADRLADTVLSVGARSMKVPGIGDKFSNGDAVDRSVST